MDALYTIPEGTAVVSWRQLRSLDKNGRPCEVCSRHMHDHDWAQLDRNGFVVDCSFASQEKAGS